MGQERLYGLAIRVLISIDGTRQRVSNRCFKIEYSDQMLELLISKYWTDNEVGHAYHT